MVSTVLFRSCTILIECAVQETPQKTGGAKPDSSALGDSLREYEALAKEVKVLRQAVDTRYALKPLCNSALQAV